MGKYLVYTEYFWLLSLQVQFGVIQCISYFRRPCTCCISETANRRAKRSKIRASGVVFISIFKYLLCIEYFWLLSVQGQFWVIRYISSFWWPCIYFWLKYSGIFVLSWNVIGILLTSKWPSRASRPLGLLLRLWCDAVGDRTPTSRTPIGRSNHYATRGRCSAIGH